MTSVETELVPTGFVGTTLRVTVGFAAPQADRRNALIVKLPHRTQAMRDRIEARGLYARETAFYRDFGPDLADLVPRCFFSAHDANSGRSAIMMEDGTAGGLYVGDNSVGCSFHEAADAMRVLAQLHARWWSDPGLERFAWLPTHASQIPDVEQAVADAWSRFPATFRALMRPATVETVELFAPRALLVAERTSEAPWTLTHGDFRLDNLLLGPNSRVVAFDWQTVARGQGARDAAYFAREEVEGNPVVETWQALLDIYHSALTASGVDYSPEAFARDIRINALHGVRIGVTALAVLDFSSERAQALAGTLLRRMNDMIELLDLPELLREEFQLP